MSFIIHPGEDCVSHKPSNVFSKCFYLGAKPYNKTYPRTMSAHFPVTFLSVFSLSPLSAPLVADTKSFLQFPSDHFSQYISQSLLLSSSSLLSICNTFCLHQFNKLLAAALWLGQKATQLINSIFATLMEKGLFSTVGIQYLPHAATVRFA